MQTVASLGMVIKFFKIFLFLVYVYGCGCVSLTCERGKNMVVDPSRTGIIGNCEPPHGFWKPNPGKSCAPLGTAMAVSLQPC